MSSYSIASSLLDALTEAKFQPPRLVTKPWGYMYEVVFGDLLVKVIDVADGQRTSLQFHRLKDEMIVPLAGDGYVELRGADGHELGPFSAKHGPVRVLPQTIHRVTGPLYYLEFETDDDGDDVDTIRLEDDYDRVR